ERHVVAETFANMIRRKPSPNDVRHITRNVVENRRIDIRVMYKGQKSDARTDAGADDADLFVTLFFQPPNGRTRVQNRLAYRLQRPADIRRNKVVGTREFRRH